MGSFRAHRLIPRWSHSTAFVALILAATNLAIWPGQVLGCECAPLPPPCAEYSATPIIFLGTVTEAIQTENGWVKLGRVQIDKAYKGISEQTVVLYDSGMCDGPTLQVGEQYLMYTHDEGVGYLPSRGCTRSRSVKYADEDLAFLNSLGAAAPTGTISGQVTKSTGNLAVTGEPLAGATVGIVNAEGKATTTTDSNGRYSFFGLQPGAYSVTATKAGFTATESEDESIATVEARGCAVLDLALNKNWLGTIRGRVTRSDGSPVQAGLRLDLVRVEGKGSEQKSALLIGSTVKTDENGEYSFAGVAPGVYKIVLNLYRVPTAEDPHLARYWPRADREAGASAVEITESVNSQQCDFQLPPALQSKRVEFVVLMPDGTPAKNVRVNIGTKMDGSFAWVEDRPVSDDNGRFSFSAVEGLDYTVVDIRAEGSVLGSQVHFSASHRTPITIRLVQKSW